MREWKGGKLHSGSKKGPVVKSQKQAVAIGLSEARKAGQDVPPAPGYAMGGPVMPPMQPMDPKRLAQLRSIKGEAAARGAQAPPQPYLGRFGAGGPVAPPPTLYAQGGEVDVSMPSAPQLPTTPSMDQNRSVGYARGGVVGGADPQTEAMKPPLRGRIKPRLNRAARVAKFEQENGDAEV